MNTATVHHHRLFLPAINMFVAVAAVVIAVFALADDPAKVTEVITQQPGAAVSQDPVDGHHDPAARRLRSRVQQVLILSLFSAASSRTPLRRAGCRSTLRRAV